jgi:hypothetical protein
MVSMWGQGSLTIVVVLEAFTFIDSVVPYVLSLVFVMYTQTFPW